MVYGHTLTTYSIPQKENKRNHMITIVVGWESSLILLSRGPTGHFSSKPKNCPVGFVAIVLITVFRGKQASIFCLSEYVGAE